MRSIRTSIRTTMTSAALAGMLALPFLLCAQDSKPNPHADLITHYEGTKTCLQCHQQEAENFFHSQHYQWQGQAPHITNAKGRKLGKINTVNDFCTSPTGNWMSIVKNSRGEVISRGCSACHAGKGLVPSQTMSPEQVENIDCLICHAPGYRRDLYASAEGKLEWRPILWNNPEGLDEVAQRVTKPTRTMCLRCHSASGGGPNFKRGDLEYKLADAPRDFDVHMGSDGKNMQCVDCHADKDHHVRGRGTDLSGSDSPGSALTCASPGCHTETPHKYAALNQHTARLACTTCHIPDFAREDATDMRRDWSKTVYKPEVDKYMADIRLEKNVKPVYAWFNGDTREQLIGEKVQRRPDGTVGMMIPQGSRTDPKAKIYAFKLHTAKLPVLNDKQWIIPISVEHFFSNGKIDPAIQMAAKEVYGLGKAEYTWTETTRYMGIFHGVRPKEKALQCLECHSEGGRIDWKGLGYAGDPMLARWKPLALAKAK